MKRVLLVRSGGGLPALDIHAGIQKALDEMNVLDDREIHESGTSAGAIVSALSCNGMDGNGMIVLLNSLSDRDVKSKPFMWRSGWMKRGYFIKHEKIRRLLERQGLPSMFASLRRPLRVWAVDEILNKIQANPCSTVIDSVLASMSISGVFPRVDGNLSDGGPLFNVPIPPDWLLYDEVWVAIAKRTLDYTGNGRSGGIERLMYNADLASTQQISCLLDLIGCQRHANPDAPDVHVLWPDVISPAGALKFNHGLIYEAYRQTMNDLEKYKVRAEVE